MKQESVHGWMQQHFVWEKEKMSLSFQSPPLATRASDMVCILLAAFIRFESLGNLNFGVNIQRMQVFSRRSLTWCKKLG
jgi:hypothetical protein